MTVQHKTVKFKAGYQLRQKQCGKLNCRNAFVIKRVFD